jgi:predicted nucleotidyltransferase
MRYSRDYIITLIRKKVKETDPEAEVILYGSRARQDDKKGSDWDLLILTHYSVSFREEQAFRHHLYDIELETGEIISTFVYSKMAWEREHSLTPLYQEISREGIVLS